MLTAPRGPAMAKGGELCPKVSVLAYDTKDNAVATVSAAAVASKQHYILGLLAGYTDSTISGLLTLTGLHASLSPIYPIHGSDQIWFSYPVPASAVNVAVSAALSASGTGGKSGYVTLLGFTAQ